MIQTCNTCEIGPNKKEVIIIIIINKTMSYLINTLSYGGFIDVTDRAVTNSAHTMFVPE